MTYKGFEYLGKKYVWHKNELYRLPYTSNLRSYGILKCKKWKDGCILGDKRKSLSQLQAMTTEIESDFVFIKDTDCPF